LVTASPASAGGWRKKGEGIIISTWKDREESVVKKEKGGNEDLGNLRLRITNFYTLMKTLYGAVF